jgi:hypothetical protein
MSARFAEIAFTPAVKRLQELHGSRANYGRGAVPDAPSDRLGPDEEEFIGERDSFYMATVSETGWPYLQHRGGPKGFLKVLDAQTLAFADYRGNMQYVSAGNLEGNDRVALILVDYVNRRRLKILGHARVAAAAADPGLMESLRDSGHSARVERGIEIRVEAFDWNCPQHLTPRYSEEELGPYLEPMKARIRELEEQLAFATSGP